MNKDFGKDQREEPQENENIEKYRTQQTIQSYRLENTVDLGSGEKLQGSDLVAEPFHQETQELRESPKKVQFTDESESRVLSVSGKSTTSKKKGKKSGKGKKGKKKKSAKKNGGSPVKKSSSLKKSKSLKKKKKGKKRKKAKKSDENLSVFNMGEDGSLQENAIFDTQKGSTGDMLRQMMQEE